MPLPVTPGNFVYSPDGPVLTDYFWNRDRFVAIQGRSGLERRRARVTGSGRWRANRSPTSTGFAGRGGSSPGRRTRNSRDDHQDVAGVVPRERMGRVHPV